VEVPPFTRQDASRSTTATNLTGTREPSSASRANLRPTLQTAPMSKRIDFAAVNAVALRALPLILPRWLPDGKRHGREFVAKNPTRADRSTGSFSINLVTGKWSDFATNDRGGDPVSLAAYLFGLSQADAARRLADMLNVDAEAQ